MTSRYLFEVDQLVVGQVVQPARGGNDDVRVLLGVLEVSLILLQGDATEVAPVPQFGLLEVSAQPLEVLVDLVSQFTGMAGYDRLVVVVPLAFGQGLDLVEDGDDKDGGLAHAGLGLAEDVLALESEGDGLDLYLAGVLKSAFPDGALELVLEEELVPSGKVGALISLVLDLGLLLLVGALVAGHDLIHVPCFQKMNISNPSTLKN